MTENDALLAAYDQQLRAEAETQNAVAVSRLGGLFLATFGGGYGFVTYAPLEAVEASDLTHMIEGVLEHFGRNPEIAQVEWKTRGHDRTPGLHEALVEQGFEPDEPESVMIGRAELLAVDVPLPAGVVLRRVSLEADVRAMAAMQALVFERGTTEEMVPELLERLGLDNGLELWVAEAGTQIVSAGRLEPVAGTDFAGIWGGATLPAWRGRGIYRALTAARARSALAAGKTLIQSDSTEYSRPILERAGLRKVTTTTPYLWHR